ncbi:MAG: GNAT family N-acetyltransferase, partial [Candidatus Thermoplasmatota archaeon]
KELVDGKGVERVVKEILRGHKKWLENQSIMLKLAEPKDCRLLWKWRNDPETRKYSFDTRYIPYKEHKAWFEKSLKSKGRVILIAMRHNLEIGVVRFDVKEDKSAEISVSVAPEHRGKGFGSKIIKDGCGYAFDCLNIDCVIARIKKINKKSIRAFSKAGFEVKEMDDVVVMEKWR